MDASVQVVAIQPPETESIGGRRIVMARMASGVRHPLNKKRLSIEI